MVLPDAPMKPWGGLGDSHFERLEDDVTFPSIFHNVLFFLKNTCINSNHVIFFSNLYMHNERYDITF